MNIDWKRKLTSRKLWAAVADFVGMLLIALKVDEGSTVQIPGAAISTPRDGKGCCEVVLRNRNLL